MRERNKLAYLKEYRKAKEITEAVENDLEFLDQMDDQFDPFQKAVEDGNFDASQPEKRAKLN